MAVVKPFRGIRYNTERIADLHTVVSQPYDKISDDLQREYYDLSPYNIVRIIHGETRADDRPDGPNVYTRARAYLQSWLDEGVFARETAPALYAYEQTFEVDGRTFVRMGMIGALQLAEFDEGIVLPHERTHAEPIEDRLKLLSTVEANTEEIFVLYPDPENRVNALLRQAIGDRKPDIDLVEIFENAVKQRVWVITDRPIIEAIEAEMAEKRNLIIADGHHRYTTGLKYRNMQRAAHPEAPANAAFNFIAATLVSMDDPGLVVLPTHREICNFAVSSGTTAQQTLDRASTWFQIEPCANIDACLAGVNGHPTGHAFGFYAGGDIGYRLLTPKDEAALVAAIPDDRTLAWRALGVVVLHRLLIEHAAGVPVKGIEDKSMVRYHRDPCQPVENIDQGKGDFVFFVSPTRMQHIRECAAAGERMPQKSTDFYPKVISGLALLPLGDALA